jgi:RNA polymerase sigma factor (TIGR02999 family)
MTRSDDITDLLRAWSQGDSEALEKLLPLVDRELKKIAHGLMKNERPEHTLQTTALVNEIIASLIADHPIEWRSRKHFYAIVSWRMRNFLIEYARARSREKRGGKDERVDFDEAVLMSDEQSKEIIMVHEALMELEKIDKRKALIVQHRYFGGMTTKEISDLLGIAPSTIDREWRFARSWLKREITGEEEG